MQSNMLGEQEISLDEIKNLELFLTQKFSLVETNVLDIAAFNKYSLPLTATLPNLVELIQKGLVTVLVNDQHKLTHIEYTQPATRCVDGKFKDAHLYHVHYVGYKPPASLTVIGNKKGA